MDRHDLDPISLIFGIAFLGLASSGLFDNVDFTPFQARWVWPVILIIAGGIVLASSVRRSAPDDAVQVPPFAGSGDEEQI